MFSKLNMLVYGDLILDEYVEGHVERISPEAPIPIIEKTGTRFAAGGAANVAMNGAPAKASVIEVRQAGGMVNYQPMVEIDLNVMPEGLPPYPVTVKQVLEQIYLPKAVAGAMVNVMVDTENPGTVWIDWATS